MADLATMKSRIASELRRPNIAAQIEQAINTAIAHYESERFWFNEAIFDFTTVANQGVYDEGDAGWENLASILKYDYVKLLIGDQPYTLDPEKAERIERLSQNGNATGQPLVWCLYAGSFRLYPVPNDVYTIRIGCQRKVAAPATDSEINNPWMVDAERLIRSHAIYELATFVLRDDALSDRFNPDNDTSPTARAFSQLKKKTGNLMAMGPLLIEPVQF